MRAMTATTLRRLIVMGLIVLWEALPRSGLIAELFLPSLSSTLAAGWNEAGEYGHALAVTLYEVAISMAFACGGGILAGALIGGVTLLRIWSQTAKTVVFVTHSLTEAVYLADEVLVMSARPGRIIDRIQVPLSRPRSYEMMGTEVFAKLRDRIWQQIRKGE